MQKFMTTISGTPKKVEGAGAGRRLKEGERQSPDARRSKVMQAALRGMEKYRNMLRELATR